MSQIPASSTTPLSTRTMTSQNNNNNTVKKNNNDHNTDLKELNRFLKTQYQQNYHHLSADWDGFVKTIISRLHTTVSHKTKTPSFTSPPPSLPPTPLSSPFLQSFAAGSVNSNVTCDSINPQNGDTLLHLMFMGYPTPCVVEALLGYYHIKMTNKTTSSDDLLSLHLPPLSLSLAARANFAGATPLHVGLMCHAPLASIALLLKYHKKSMQLLPSKQLKESCYHKQKLPLSGIPMTGGMYPLHVVCSRRFRRRMRLRYGNDNDKEDDKKDETTDSVALLQILIDDYPSILISDRHYSRHNDDNNNVTDHYPRLLHLLWDTHGSSLGYDNDYNGYRSNHTIGSDMSLLSSSSSLYRSKSFSAGGGFGVFPSMTQINKRCERIASCRSKVWAMVNVLLSEITNDEESSRRYCSRPLHHLAQYPSCPPGLMTLALDVNPSMVFNLKEMDEMGRVPIHYAAIASSHKWGDDDFNDNDGEKAKDGDHGTTTTESAININDTSYPFISTIRQRCPLIFDHMDNIVNKHDDISNDNCRRPCTSRRSSVSPSLVETLVSHFPLACRIVDNRGRLPLHYALEAFMLRQSRRCRRENDDVIVRSVVDVYPEGLAVVDPVTGFYPFMMAGVGRMGQQRRQSRGGSGDEREEKKERNDNDDVGGVDFIFYLLRGCPEVVNGKHLAVFSSLLS